MTTLKDNLAKIQAGKPVKKPRTKKKTKKRVNGRAVAKQQVDRKRFCQELIANSMNATQAYATLRPDVTPKSAATLGHRLLNEVETINILTPMLQDLFTEAGVTNEWIFRRWVEISQGSPLDYFKITDEGDLGDLDLTALTPAERNNLKSITVNNTQYGRNIKVEVYDAQKAIDTMGRHLGLLVEKLADKDVDRIGDMIEKGVARIKANKDLDAWKELITDAEFTETG